MDRENATLQEQICRLKRDIEQKQLQIRNQHEELRKSQIRLDEYEEHTAGLERKVKELQDELSNSRHEECNVM